MHSRRPARDKTLLQLLVTAGLASDANLLANEISRKLRIPDCNTTRGLKKCHESFETVSVALDNVYAQTREYSGSQVVASDRLASAILVLYSRMGDDNILRKRIVSETRFLERAVALLTSPWARETAVLILSRFSHQRDSEVLQVIARFTSAILDFVETTVCVLSHAITCAIDAAIPDPEVVAALPRVLRFMLNVVLLPASTSLSFHHLVTFCHETAYQYPVPFLANPDSINFLVACARSPDICTRICSQRALIDVCAQLADSRQREHKPEPTSRDVFESLQTYYRDTEPFVSQLLQDGDMLKALANEYKTNSDCSHLQLGQQVAALILRSETAIRAFTQPDNEGAEEVLEMLRVCEDAVRNAADDTNKLDITADVLHIHTVLVSKGQLCPASHYAEEALKRHPCFPFFHYTLANFVCGRDESITRVLHADKGLQCRDGMTDNMQQQLLYLSVSHSLLVVSRMAQGLPLDLRMKEVNVLLGKALDNANTFMRVAPLDHTLMPSMTAVGTLIDLLRNGHIWKDEKFQTIRKSFTRICDIARCNGWGFTLLKDCDALDKILDGMPSAWDTWSSVISRQPKRGYKAPASDSDHSDVDISVWFEKLNTTPCFSRECELQGATPGAQRYGLAQLHTCSFCNCGSVTLKNCAGCQKTWYCNNVCQKMHWKSHREECKAGRINENAK
ncbi:hypothetical protein FB45DRAFT_1153563 [Roridomyces roridus]|uniref:MYND-type domain-containing protein n=1 Tax=Roridomyces roridus TaxID=1738132 RepID=A0AAD7AZ54_9AGAR|nr:hypothetical protein FB45DRAFT_1153563 [Roridomyces roridus]